jgi:hypothetical protein
MNVHTCPSREVAAMNLWRNIGMCADARFRSLDPSINISGELETRKAAFRLSAIWSQRIHSGFTA